jgi:radical SAM protein with 4Fe4S-binding SPASM domain
MTADRESEYRHLARKMSWRSSPDEAGRFLHVFIELNNTCNLRCRMCGFSDPRVESVRRYHMPAAVFGSIARQVFPLTTYLHMSLMTEPFMTPDFPDRLMLVAEHQVPYSRIVTNGTLLTERVIDKVLDAGITTFTVSIDGGTKELYEDIRAGSRFETVLAKIDLFKELRARRRSAVTRLQINHVLMERNVDHFEEFLKLLEKIGPEQVDVRTVQPMTATSGWESVDEAFFAKVRRVRPLLAEFCSRTGVEHCGFIRDQAGLIELFAEDGLPMTCRRPWDNMAIHANGDVNPCVSWTRPPIGNLARQSFTEIWKGPRMTALRHEFEMAQPGIDCQHCAIKMTVSPGTYDDFFYRMVSKDEGWSAVDV